MNFRELVESCQLDRSSDLIFLGGGNMAGAVLRAAVKSGFATHDNIVISVKSEESEKKWKNEGFTHVYRDNNEMLSKHTGVLFICVKPQFFYDVIRSITPHIDGISLIVSIMAGISTTQLAKTFGPLFISSLPPIVRLMPSTPCLVGLSASLICYNELPPNHRLSIVTGLAEKTGTYTILNEKQFNAGTAVASSGPAFVYILIEALADGGVLAGLPRKEAMALAIQTFQGAATMVEKMDKHPGALKDEVCSAGGTTIAGVRALEKAGVRSALIEAVKATVDRADSMSG